MSFHPLVSVVAGEHFGSWTEPLFSSVFVSVRERWEGRAGAGSCLGWLRICGPCSCHPLLSQPFIATATDALNTATWASRRRHLATWVDLLMAQLLPISSSTGMRLEAFGRWNLAQTMQCFQHLPVHNVHFFYVNFWNACLQLFHPFSSASEQYQWHSHREYHVSLTQEIPFQAHGVILCRARSWNSMILVGPFQL